MNGWAFALLAIIAVESLFTVARIGKPRVPLTPAQAIYALIEWGILAFLTVMAATS